jgi:hypothetical protein
MSVSGNPALQDKLKKPRFMRGFFLRVVTIFREKSDAQGTHQKSTYELHITALVDRN